MKLVREEGFEPPIWTCTGPALNTKLLPVVPGFSQPSKSSLAVRLSTPNILSGIEPPPLKSFPGSDVQIAGCPGRMTIRRFRKRNPTSDPIIDVSYSQLSSVKFIQYFTWELWNFVLLNYFQLLDHLDHTRYHFPHIGYKMPI